MYTRGLDYNSILDTEIVASFSYPLDLSELTNLPDADEREEGDASFSIHYLVQ